jgi:asparagine synthetase B (glutamine-hydrolysing)
VCGIAGIADCSKQPLDAGLLEAMTQSLAHREPDGEGYDSAPTPVTESVQAILRW